MRFGILLCCMAAFAYGQPNLMPWPARVEMGEGRLAIPANFAVAFTAYSEPRLEDAARRLGGRVASGASATLVIQCERAGDEDESYRLVITPQGARLSAREAVGVLRGLATFRQLIGTDSQDQRGAPVLDIQDRPRFAWRGLLMDVSRHWMPVEVVKRNLEGMAAVKLNVFHWHLSDDQGFRAESKRFPKLQQLGSDGLFYTQDQIRDVIASAHERGIRVVPEFDVPGHTTSWLVGYPELASAPGPYSIERRWGVFDPALDPTRESTYEFLDVFIGEMAALFPDSYFHIGGDEVTGKQWMSSARIRAFMRKHGLKTADDLQAYFNGRLQKIVAKHGKKMEGWDEILRPDLPKNVVVQSWRGPKSLRDAARQVFPAILSAGYYLDHMEPASKLYSVDPVSGDAAALSGEQKARILGGEIAMWGEFVSPENVDSRIWPRAAAVAERLWSDRDVRDVTSMYQRLEATSEELDRLGLTHRSSYVPMLERIANGRPLEPLKTLADVLEPATFGQRIRTHKYNQQTPLVGLVDAVRPESDRAREFAALVDRDDRVQIREWLMRWRDDRAEEQPDLSATLKHLAEIGLQALDDLEHGTRPPEAWVAQQRAFLETMQKPQGEVRFAIAPSIQKLLTAATSVSTQP